MSKVCGLPNQHVHKFIQRKCLRPFGEQAFYLTPHFLKQSAFSIIVQMDWIIPMAKGSETIWVIKVAQQLQMSAARKIPDGSFMFVKYFKELGNTSRGKVHPNYPDYHSGHVLSLDIDLVLKSGIWNLRHSSKIMFTGLSLLKPSNSLAIPL
jgi:hypothetical protein